MLVRAAEIVYGDGCCAVVGSENQTLLGHHDNEPFAFFSFKNAGDYMWSASCTEGIRWCLCVLLSKLHLAKVEDILPDVLYNFRLFHPVVELIVPIYVTLHSVKWLLMLSGFIVTSAHLRE